MDDRNHEDLIIHLNSKEMGKLIGSIEIPPEPNEALKKLMTENISIDIEENEER